MISTSFYERRKGSKEVDFTDRRAMNNVVSKYFRI